MKKVEKAEDAYEFMGAIVAFVPKSYYYGQGKGSILSNKTVFAIIGKKIFSYIICEPYTVYEKCLNLYLFQDNSSIYENIILTSTTLKIYEKSYFDIRFATIAEIRVLKDLVDLNRIKISELSKAETIYMLNDILIYDPVLNWVNANYNQDTLDITLEWYKDREKEKTQILGNNIYDI
ncbi:MAG TPA: hypothetical protein LFW20_08055 [Rickettsia endosymbiont of Omalisus fontisbellaquei]|nr:hypothetical protein [Rickettsia endosymbiont of Omalisus fontisbellaquei]